MDDESGPVRSGIVVLTLLGSELAHMALSFTRS